MSTAFTLPPHCLPVTFLSSASPTTEVPGATNGGSRAVLSAFRCAYPAQLAASRSHTDSCRKAPLLPCVPTAFVAKTAPFLQSSEPLSFKAFPPAHREPIWAAVKR